MKHLIITLVLSVFLTAIAAGQKSEFRWLSASTDSVIFEQVHTAFSSELTPDEDPQSNTVPMTVKFIERVGLRDSSALVVIGEKENKSGPYTVFRAFNYDLKTNTKSPVRGKDAEWFWMWHVEKVTHLTSAAETDIVFHFLDCTECEAEQLLAAFQYAPSTGKWDVLQWSEQDGPALLIGSDPQYGDDIYYYDCLHTVSDITGDGVEDVATRCRTSGQADPEDPAKQIIKDETLLYTAQRGTLTRIVVTNDSQYFSQVQQALCATSKRSSSLCPKPRPAHGGKRKQ